MHTIMLNLHCSICRQFWRAISKEWACGETIPIPFDEQFPRAPIDERCRNPCLHKHENSTLENADLVESKSLNAYTDVPNDSAQE
jgi:hypothetical protein